MSKIKLEPTATAQWQSLVVDAENACDCTLSEDMESYLVFLLMRFIGRPEMANSILAIDYLKSLLEHGRIREENLRDVGDRCLLYSGLFPHRANRRRVKISYFVDLGRSAYSQLSATQGEVSASFFRELSQGFVSLMDVLHVIREMGTSLPSLSPIEATELWHDTGSQQALKTAKAYAVDGAFFTSLPNSRH